MKFCMLRDDELGVETESSQESLGVLKPNIEELEMLLEAYFVQIDGTLNKLSHVCLCIFTANCQALLSFIYYLSPILKPETSEHIFLRNCLLLEKIHDAHVIMNTDRIVTTIKENICNHN